MGGLFNILYSSCLLYIFTLQSIFLYIVQGYNKMLDKLNLKRDKIVDIQKALQTADINNDMQVDFDEWRQDLKT